MTESGAAPLGGQSADSVREAIRFAEEYGYNRWQEARDHYTALEQVKDAAWIAEPWLERAADLHPRTNAVRAHRNLQRALAQAGLVVSSE